MKIAIVILNYKGKQLLADFLPSVVKHTPRRLAEIWVVDNSSKDGSVEFVANNFPYVYIQRNNRNFGFAKGYNQALQKIEADIYCLLNSDVEVTEGWLEPIIKSFKASEKIAAIQPKILDYKNKSKFEYAGAAGGYIDQFGYAFCRGRIFDHLEFDEGQYNDSAKIFWASGACLFVRSLIFHELGGFDEDFFAHYEEIDLCWRIQHQNLEVWCEPASTVYHVGGATLNKSNHKKTYLNHRNSLLTLVKNLPTNAFLYVLPVRLLLDFLSVIYNLIKIKPKHSLAIIKAQIDFYTRLPKTLKKRSAAPKIKNYAHTKSVVWRYFVMKNRRFGDM